MITKKEMMIVLIEEGIGLIEASEATLSVDSFRSVIKKIREKHGASS